MTLWWRKFRAPVKREHAELYLRWLLVSFALSVIGIRVWLELTGYPQLGNATLHIAHVLWGGLLLFIAAVLPLVIANRSALMAGALFAGAGMGFFIDEVGKFITRTNDYFYAPALPLIYGFFLLTVMLYLRIRRPVATKDIRSELYAVFDSFSEVLENDLEASELALLKQRLRRISTRVEDPNVRRLVLSLLSVVEHESFMSVQDSPVWWEDIVSWIKRYEQRWLKKSLLRWLLIITYLMTGLSTFLQALEVTRAFFSATARTNFLENLIASGDLLAQQAFGWFVLTTVLEGVIGTVLMVAAYFLIRRLEERATQLAALTLLLFLSSVNLLVIYFDQFQALLTSLFFFLLYVLTRRYHQRFVQQKEDSRLIA